MIEHCRVVLIGVGAYTPLGPNVPTTYKSLLEGENGVVLNEELINEFPQYADEAPLVANSAKVEFDVTERNRLKQTDIKLVRVHESGRYFLKAMIEAGLHAGVMDDKLQFDPRIKPNKRGVRVGTGFGGATVAVEAYERMKRGKLLGKNFILQGLPGRQASVPGKLIEAHGGDVEGHLAECAASLVAAENAIDKLKSGRVDVIFAGGTEGPIVHVSNGMFHGTSALAKTQNPMEAPRPFDDDSPGTVLGAGAGVAVFMREKDALNRGAEPIAEVVGYWKNNDARKDTAPSGPEGKECMYEAMSMAEMTIGEELQDILVIAHAAGAPVGDDVEARNINEVLEGRRIAGVKGPKDQLSHLGGASGIVGLILGVQAMREGVLPGSPKGLLSPNENVKWDIPLKTIQRRIGAVMINAFGFTGYNSSIILIPYR